MPNVRKRRPVKKIVASTTKSRNLPRKKRRQSFARASATARTKTSSANFFSKVLTFLLISFLGIVAIVLVVFFLLSQQSRWNGKDRFTVLLIDQSEDDHIKHELSLLTLNGQDGEISFLSLPPDLHLQALRKYGTFSTDSLLSLYDQEQLTTKYVEGTLTYDLGIVIDGRLFIDKPIVDKGNTINVETAVFHSLFDFQSGTVRWGDRWKIWQAVAGKKDQIVNISAKEPFFVHDDQERKVLDSISMDRIVERYFSRDNFLKQRWNVAVLNLTKESGVATFWGKRLKQAGFELITVDSVSPDDTQTSSTIYLSEKASQNESVVNTLRALFPIELELQVNSAITQKYRSDVVFFISDNFVKEYGGKWDVE